MTILHVITGLKVGGAERALYNLLNSGITEYGNVEVVSLTGPGYYGPLISALGIPVHYLDFAQLARATHDVHGLSRIVRKARPAIVQGWMYHGNLAAMLARAVSPGRPSLVWNVRHSLYDIAQERRGTRWAIRIAAALSRFVDRIVYNSDLSKLQHEAFGFCGAQASVIGNGFDTESWCPNLAARRETRRSLGLSDDDRLVGFVARYHPMKDVPTFLKALAIAMADDARLHCAMVGRDTGPDNPSLARLIANLPAARMHFLGQREDVHKLMNGFDLFCLSSWSEAFPNVLGEAMACGVPCVSTEVGDSRRIIGDTGFVVPRSDPEAMACALMKALAEPLSVRLERGKAARQRIEDNFSLQFCVNQYREVYEALRARQRSTGNPLR